METIAPNTTRIDVEFHGKPNYIAACLLEGEGGPALIDPGSPSLLDVPCLPMVLEHASFPGKQNRMSFF